MTVSVQRYLVLQTEPTPYFLGFVRELARCVDGEVDVFFTSENSSQPWNLSLDGYNATVLSPNLLQAAAMLNRAVLDRGYRVVYIAGWGERLMRFALLVCWFHNIPVVVESDTPLPVGLPLWKRIIKRLVYPIMFRIPAMMLPFGTRQAGYFRHYGVENKRITVIQYTVDVEYIMQRCAELGQAGRLATRQRLGFSNDDVVFIFVGRLHECKGIRVLLESFSILSENHSNLRLLLVGDGPERELLQNAMKHNTHITYTGRLDQEGVIEMQHASDVAILPSLFEPYGLVVHESMAARLPVIVSDRVGCIDDLLFDRETGFIVPAGNPAALAQSMCMLLDDTLLREKTGLNGENLISQWTLANSANRVKDVLLECESR
ncbi:MAG: glycosyltransferase family 4 protein [Desulfuromonadaceae bacterium]|nr:glycosyltransferase family 4 protein [Desulfuromonadaceae bacterium]